jgi:hypothetical protein
MLYPGNRYDEIRSPLRFEEVRTLLHAAAELVGCIESGRPRPEFSRELLKCSSNVRGILVWEKSPERKQAISEMARIAAAADKLLKEMRAAHQPARYQIALSWLFDDPFNLPTNEEGERKFADLTEEIWWLSELYHANRAGMVRRGYPREQAKEWAVIQAKHLYEKYRRKRPTSTAGNDFHGLCGLIWQLATGEPDRVLERQIKHVLSPNSPIGFLNSKGTLIPP